MLAITEDPNFNIDDNGDLKKELIGHTLENVKICWKFYLNIYDFCANLFHKNPVHKKTILYQPRKPP